MYCTKAKQRLKLKANFILSLLCLMGYLSSASITVENYSKNDLFTTFPWLSSIINTSNCQNGDKVELYTAGIFTYLIVEADNQRTMYNNEGSRYCGDRENFSCVEVYGLEGPTEVWTCDDNPTPTDSYIAPGTYDVVGCPGDQFEFLVGVFPPDDGVLCNLSFNAVDIDPTTNLPATENNNFDSETCTLSFTFNGEGTLYYTGGTSPVTPATANWNFNLIYEESCQPQPPVTNNLFVDYPWLTSIINLANCTQGDMVQLYNAGIFDYLIIETNNQRTMYNNEGRRYCGDRENFSCVEAYGLEGPISTWTCGDQPPVGENCLIEDPLTLGFIQSAIAAGNAQQNCTSPYRITQIDYNGSSYFKTEIGASANPPANSPCGISEYFGDTRDCEGNIICWVALLGPPPNYNEEVCTAINNGQGMQTVIWEYEEVIQPTAAIFEQYNWLSSIIKPTDCQNGDKVELYTAGIFDYLIIETNNQRTMYNNEGRRYCGDRENFSCVEAYGLEGPISTWTCGDQPPVGENCLIENPLTLGFIQSAIAAGNAQQNCTSPFRITQIDYNGSSYFKTEIGASANPPANSPCGISEYFGDTRDCEGNIICWVALLGPPPNYNEEVCTAINNGQGMQTVIWEYEEVIQPTSAIFEQYNWLSSIVNPTDCNQYTSIREYDLGSFAYVYIESPTGGVLYFEDGTRYCTSSDTRSCEMLYELTNPTNTYNCDGSVTADYTFTICPGESVELVPEYNTRLVECICPPCPPVGPVGPPPVEWNPVPGVCSDNPTCFSPTVSPTETTFYTAIAEGQNIGSPGCGPVGPLPALKETTFLVIVSEEGCEQNACEYDDFAQTPDWLSTLIDQDTDISQKISKHNFNGELVYFRDVDSDGGSYNLYNCLGEIICSPQIYNNTIECPDFNYEETYKQQIYNNSCGSQASGLGWVKEIMYLPPVDECEPHSIEAFKYFGKNHFILKSSADCANDTSDDSFTIVNCNKELVCSTNCNDAILEATQDAYELWTYDASQHDGYDQIYTICSGESITLEAIYSVQYISCQCPPCGPVGPPADPNVDWFPLSSACSSCLTLTVSPTETTAYASYADGVTTGSSGCGGPSGSGARSTLTTFLVIVDDEDCGNLKTAPSNQANLKILPKVNIYPNPTSDIVTIDLTEIASTQDSLNTLSTLTLKSTNGQILQYLQLQPTTEKSQQIDLSNYATGVYLLEYFNGETITVEKIIKR